METEKAALNITAETVLDLAEFGAEGKITFQPLTPRRLMALQDNVGRCTHLDKDEKTAWQEIGKIRMYTAMGYITAAPFDYRNLESVMRYLDLLESRQAGAGMALLAKIYETAETLNERRTSNPFVASPPAMTPASEAPPSIRPS